MKNPRRLSRHQRIPPLPLCPPSFLCLTCPVAVLTDSFILRTLTCAEIALVSACHPHSSGMHVYARTFLGFHHLIAQCWSELSIILEPYDFRCFRMVIFKLLAYTLLLQLNNELYRRFSPRPTIPAWYKKWIHTQDVTFPLAARAEAAAIENLKRPPTNFKVPALDCRHPTQVRSTQVTAACDQPANHLPIATDQPAYILQRKAGQTRVAIRCRKLVSTTAEICGRWGHTKLLAPPRILRPQMISEEICHQVVQSNIYVDELGKSHPVLSFDSDLYLEHVLHGGLTYSHDDVRCSGEDGVKIRGAVMNDVVVLASTKIEIRTVDVTITKGAVEDEESGFQLSTSCATQASCISGHDTYVFRGQVNHCPYSVVRAEQLHVLEVLDPADPHRAVVNDEHHLYLRLTVKEPAPPECADAYQYHHNTEFRELYIVWAADAYDIDGLDQLDGHDVDLQLEERLTDNYQDVRLAQRIHNLTVELSKELCRLSRPAWLSDTVSPWHEDSLLRTRGEIIQELTCLKTDVVVTLGDHLEDKCFADAIPVTKGGERLLMEARTRVLFPAVEVREVACSPLTSALFKIGEWFVTADPRVRTVDLVTSPMGLSKQWHTGPVDDHSTYVTDLLYTREEIASYYQLISHHPMRKRVLEQFSAEYCARSGKCGNYQPPSGYFDMKHLSEELNPLSWWDHALQLAEDMGAVCSCLVLTYLLLSTIYSLGNFFNLRFCQNYSSHDAINLAILPGRLLRDYAQQVADQRVQASHAGQPEAPV